MSAQEIIAGCIKKDPRCQRILVEQYANTLLTVSRRYAPNHADAEDVLQDAFIKIFGAIKQFDPRKGVLEAWMRKIVINTALRRLNKKCFTREKSVDQFADIKLSPAAYDHLQAEDVMSLINTLPDGYRQVFNLAVVEGYSHKEITTILQISESTSRSNLSRAKKLFTQKIEKSRKARTMAEDKLESFIKKQVEQHETPTDPAMLWEKIQAKQQEEEKPRRRFLIFWWLLGSICLVGAIIFALAYTVTDQQAKIDRDEQAVVNLPAGVDQVAATNKDLVAPGTLLDHTTVDSTNAKQAASLSDRSASRAVASTAARTPLPNKQTTTTEFTSGMDATPKPQRATPSVALETGDTHTSSLHVTTPDEPQNRLLTPPIQTAPYISSDHERPTEPNGYNLHHQDVFARGACARLPMVAMQVVPSETKNSQLPQPSFLAPAEATQHERWHFALGAAVAYGQAQPTLSARNNSPADYLQVRKDTETPLDAVRINLDFQLRHQSGLYAKSGIEYEQINERFEAYLEWDSTQVQSEQILAIRIARDGTSSETLGNGEVTTTYWTQQQIYNHYHSVDIPLIIGYQSTKNGNRLGWFVEGGASANLWFSGSGKVINVENRLSSLSQNTGILRTRTGISLLGAVGLNYRLSHHLSIWANPAVKYHLSSVTTIQYPLEQRYLNLAFNLGIRYHW